MAKQKISPLRMCIACREMKEKSGMFRIVKNKENEIFLDLSFKAAGRGAYICKDANCMEKLKKRRLLNKTFSSEIPMEVYAKIEEEFFATR